MLSEPPKTKGTIGLRALLTAATLFAVGMTASVVYIPWFLASRENINSVIHDFNREVMRGTSQEIGKLFNNVISTKQFVYRMLAQDLVDVYDREQMEAFYLDLLEANPQFSWMEFGYPNGDFLGVERQPDGRFRVVQYQWDESFGGVTPSSEAEERIAQRRALVQQFQATGEWDESQPQATYTSEIYSLEGEASERAEEKAVYYAPLRPWYQVAAENPGKDAWTDLYPFFESKQLGLDSSITFEPEGELVGVIAVSFSVQHISEYLQQQYLNQIELAETGAVFLFNSQGQLIASTGSESLVREADTAEGMTLKHLRESKNPYVQMAFKTLRDRNLSPDRIASLQQWHYTDPSSGELYHIAVKPTEHQDWLVGTVVPDAMFTGAIRHNRNLLLLAVGGFILVIAVGAIVLGDRAIARPILTITDAAAAIEAENFQAATLNPVTARTDELGQLARVFQTMAREVYLRAEDLKQQVQELKIEIDEVKRQKQVKEIVDTDFFQDLRQKARQARQQRQQRQQRRSEGMGSEE